MRFAYYTLAFVVVLIGLGRLSRTPGSGRMPKRFSTVRWA